MKTFREIEGVLHKIGINPTYPIVSNLVRGLARIDQMDKAMAILRILVMSSAVPDTVTYNMVIENLCKIWNQPWSS